MLASVLVSVIVSVPLPACTIEDASSGPVPCVWYAGDAGNHRGDSFRVWRNGNFTYITDHAAKHLLGLI